MISSVQNSALSALRAFSTCVRSNSNNVANVNTHGFKKTRVTMATAEPDGVKANVEQVNTAGAVVYQKEESGLEEVELSHVDLGQEFPKMTLNKNLYKANLKTLQVADEMLGDLLELKA